MVTYEAPGSRVPQPWAAGAGAALWAQALEKAALLVLRFVAAHAARRKARATRYELEGMDERDLRDIGLTAGDVYRLTGTVPDSLRYPRGAARFL